MVTPATSHLDPPKNWDEFEDICADLFGREWKDNNTTRYGRQGQRQNGVDVYGQPGGQKYAGVQCKGRSTWPPKPLTTADIDEEVEKAKAHKPALSEFTITTIAPNDAQLQDHARKLTEQNEKEGLFKVYVVGWTEITRRLTQYADLVDKHFGYVSAGLIRDEVRDIPELVVQKFREQLPALGAGTQSLPAIPAAAPDAAITQAMERDLAGRYDAAMQRALFPENRKLDEYQNLADDALNQQYAGVSAALRRRVILRASRTAAIRGSIERGELLLQEAQRLSGGDSDLPARARIAQAKGDVEFAISLLRDEKDADSRSTLLDILFRKRGRDAALGWLAEEKVDVPDLTVNGVHTLSLCHLQRLDIESIRIALGKFTPDQGKEGPYLLFMRAAASLASVLPIPEHDLPLTGLPLEVMRARVILPDAEAAARLDSAAADLSTFMPIAATLRMREGKRLAEAYASWCELLHPYRKAAGLARLRSEMKDPKTALARLQFAFAYDPEFRPDDLAQYLERREQLGGFDDSEIRAMLVLRLHGNNPGAVAELIARYRMKLEAAFPPLSITPIEIQALAKAGDAPSARLLLNAHADQFSADARAGLEAEVAKAEGADPIQEDLRLYKTTKSVGALRSLLTTVGSRGDDRAVARYSEELYQRTQDPQDIARAARALTNVGDSKEFLRVIGAYPFLQGRDTTLARRYGWELFHSGKLKEAKDIAERLEKWVPPARDLNLEIAIAIESGEWDSLAVTLAAFLEDASKHSALELIRAASLAQASGRGPMMDLLRAAVAKAEPDPNVWLGAYTLIIEEGLEDDVPEAHEWFQRALTLSDSDGPIQRFELKDLLPQQQEWNERTRTISDSIVRGEIPLILAATGLRTTVLDILLRNLIRNGALTEPRKRVAVPLFSGTRAPARCGTSRPGETQAQFPVLFARNVEPHRVGFQNRRDLRRFLTGGW
jgi:hypothetical protein